MYSLSLNVFASQSCSVLLMWVLSPGSFLSSLSCPMSSPGSARGSRSASEKREAVRAALLAFMARDPFWTARLRSRHEVQSVLLSSRHHCVVDRERTAG